MNDFSYLEGAKITGDETREFTLLSIQLPNGRNPTFIGRIASESNKPFARELAARQIKKHKLMQGASINPDLALADAKKTRDEDRELYAKYVVTGWKDVCDGDGKDVKFSPADCLKFFRALPDDMFDMVRNFYATTSNFRETVSQEEAGEKGKH